MAQVYTRRLAAANLTGPGSTQLYVNNSPNVIVIRNIIVTSLAAGSSFIGTYIQLPGSTFFWLTFESLANNTTRSYDLRQELLAGEEIWAQHAFGGGTFLITAYSLPNP